MAPLHAYSARHTVCWGAFMLACQFSGLMDRGSIHAAKLEIRGSRMYVERDPTPVAVHREHHWEFAGRYFSRFDVVGPLTVILIGVEDTPGRSFPEVKVWFADGVLHSPSGHIVCLDESSDTWLELPSRSRYSKIVLNEWSAR